MRKLLICMILLSSWFTVLKRIEPSPLYQVISYKEYRQQYSADPSVPVIPEPYSENAVADGPGIRSLEETGDASSSSGSRGLKRRHDDSLDSTDAEVAEVMLGKKHKPMDPK